MGSGLYLLLLIPLLLELTASFGYDYPFVLVLRRFMTRRFALVQSIGLSPVDKKLGVRARDLVLVLVRSRLG